MHIIDYRSVEPGLIAILRLLHERMEPRQHRSLSGDAKTGRPVPLLSGFMIRRIDLSRQQRAV